MLIKINKIIKNVSKSVDNIVIMMYIYGVNEN